MAFLHSITAKLDTFKLVGEGGAGWAKNDTLIKDINLSMKSFWRRWLSTVDDAPGLLTNILDELGSKRSADADYKYCTLVIDAMSIKQHISYSQKEKKHIGKARNKIISRNNVAAIQLILYWLERWHRDEKYFYF